MACVRRAWLTLGALSVPLEDERQGYFCQSLDLGWPDVRDVVSNRPSQDGVDDRTQYMGSRAISAAITAMASAGVGKIDDVASSFAPFMVPSARPVLHYVLDRSGATERTLTLRSAGYAWPIAGPFQRDIQLQWVAADPVARDPVVQIATAWSGTTGALGRVYPLVFDRAYPVGSGVATTGTIIGHGDVPIRPYLRIFGPITAPIAHMQQSNPNGGGQVALTNRIDAGHFVGVDTVAHTAYMDDDPAQSVLADLDWANTVWPVLANAPASTLLSLMGTGTTSSTQVAATWQDGYLT